METVFLTSFSTGTNKRLVQTKPGENRGRYLVEHKHKHEPKQEHEQEQKQEQECAGPPAQPGLSEPVETLAVSHHGQGDLLQDHLPIVMVMVMTFSGLHGHGHAHAHGHAHGHDLFQDNI